MNLSDMLLVVAPNQFPQRHKTPSSNTFSFSTTTQVSPSCRMTYTSSNNSNLEETETSNIINDMIIDENVAQDNSSKITHEKGCGPNFLLQSWKLNCSRLEYVHHTNFI